MPVNMAGLDTTYENAYQVAIDLVQDKFEQLISGPDGSTALYRIVLEKFDDIANALGELTPQRIDLVIEQVPAPEITEFVPDRPTKPTIGIDLPGRPEDPNIPDLDISGITRPDMSDLRAPDIFINPGQATYSTSLLTALKAKLLSDIQSGGTGLADAVENAIFNREVERALLAHHDAQDRISAEWSKRGFPLPTGALITALTEEELNYTNKRLDVSREISIKQAELAQTNTHFSIQQGVGLETVLMNFATACQNRIFEASKAYADALIALYNVEATKYKIMAEIYQILVTAKIEELKGRVQIYTAEVEAYKAAVQAEATRINAVAEVFRVELEQYKTDAAVYGTVSEVAVKVFSARIEQAVAKANLFLKDAEIEIKNYEAIKGLNIEALKASAQVMSQLVAGMWSSVSAAAEVRASGSTSTETRLTG